MRYVNRKTIEPDVEIWTWFCSTIDGKPASGGPVLCHSSYVVRNGALEEGNYCDGFVEQGPLLHECKLPGTAPDFGLELYDISYKVNLKWTIV